MARRSSSVRRSPMKKLEQIFYTALRIHNPAERDAFLRRKCGADAQLKAEVEKLLWADAAVGDFFTPDCAEATWAGLSRGAGSARSRKSKPDKPSRRRTK